MINDTNRLEYYDLAFKIYPQNNDRKTLGSSKGVMWSNLLFRIILLQHGGQMGK